MLAATNSWAGDIIVVLDLHPIFDRRPLREQRTKVADPPFMAATKALWCLAFQIELDHLLGRLGRLVGRFNGRTVGRRWSDLVAETDPGNLKVIQRVDADDHRRLPSDQFLLAVRVGNPNHRGFVRHQIDAVDGRISRFHFFGVQHLNRKAGQRLRWNGKFSREHLGIVDADLHGKFLIDSHKLDGSIPDLLCCRDTELQFAAG